MRKHLIFFGYWFLASLVVPSELAWGYIDPATTTYIIQVSTAIVVTVGVSLSIFLYRFQMIVTNLKVLAHALVRRLGAVGLGGSPRRGRPGAGATAAGAGAAAGVGVGAAAGAGSAAPLTEAEALAAGLIDCPIPARENYAAVAPAPADTAAAATAAAPAPPLADRLKSWAAGLGHDERSPRDRLLVSVLLVSAVTMTYGIFNMFDSVITNRKLLFFTFPEIAGPILVFCLVMFAVLMGLLFVARGRVFDFLVCVGLSFLVCGYLQNTFFNTGLGQLMGQQLTWDDLRVSRVFGNLALWLGIFALVFWSGLTRREGVRRLFRKGLVSASALIIVVQAVALFSIIPLVRDWNPEHNDGIVEVLSRDGLYDVSSEENVIVIIIDMMDEEYVNLLVDLDPHIYDFMDGFTRFTNNMSVYNATFPSMVHIMTGVPLDLDMQSFDYIDYAYTHPSFIGDIRDQGYSCNIYTDKPYSYTRASQFEGLADNLNVSTYTLRVVKAPAQLFRLSLLKSAPLSLKPTFWLSSGILGYGSIGKGGTGAEPYWATEDVRFYAELTDERLNAVEGPRFSFIHLLGFHGPWRMTAQAQDAGRDVPGEEQFRGCFFILEEYFSQLKELGLYKDATIIVTGDHPEHTGSKVPDKPMLVGCFVKPSGEEGTPLRHNSAPVTFENLRATCVEAAGGDAASWGRTYFEIGEDEPGERHYYNRFTDADDGKHYMTDFLIIGDAREWDNWELVELIPFEANRWF